MLLNWLILGVVFTRLLQSESVELLAETLCTLFLDTLITDPAYHGISGGRIQNTPNFEET